MRLRTHRGNLVLWRASRCPDEHDRGLWFTRPARSVRIRRQMRTGVLLAILGVMRLAAVARPRWRALLAGVVLTTAGVMLRDGAAGIVMIPGMLSLLSALLVPFDPVTAGPRRRELERELAAYSTPDQRSDLEAILDRYPDSATGELREILARQAAAGAAPSSAVSSPYG
jgi:hypothetical protein